MELLNGSSASFLTPKKKMLGIFICVIPKHIINNNKDNIWW